MIVDVNLNPARGSETGKVRPCIVVTNNTYNEKVPVIQVVPITEWNQKKARILTNVEILPTIENGSQNFRLPTACKRDRLIIKCD